MRVAGGKSPVLTPEFRAGESFLRVLAVPGHTKGCAKFTSIRDEVPV